MRPFCRERGITESSFYYWRKQLRKRESVQFAVARNQAYGPRANNRTVRKDTETLNVGPRVTSPAICAFA